jgi:flagellar basal-body rod protein FlgC
MDLLTAMDVSATGMVAQRVRLNVISMNLANVHTTRTEAGTPYRRRTVIFRSSPMERSFQKALDDQFSQELQGVKVVRIEKRGGDFNKVFDPAHPDADESGYVSYPNVNLVEEMVGMLQASRSYEANVSAIKAAKDMALKALEIGR